MFAGCGNEIINWDYRTGEMINVFSGHKKAVCCVRVAGGFLYSAAGDNTVKRWNLEVFRKQFFAVFFTLSRRMNLWRLTKLLETI